MTKLLQRILVPIDGSDGSVRAAYWAAAMARSMGANLTLFYVVQMSGIQLMGMRNFDKADVDKHGREMAEEAMSSARRAVSEYIGNADEEVAFGDPATEIINAAGKEGISLVVMGSRGLSPLKELVIGSVSDKVMRHAPVPVTVVR